MDGLVLHDDVTAYTSTLISLSLRGSVFVVAANAADRYPTSTLWQALHGTLDPPPPTDSNGALYFNRNPTLFHAVLDAAAIDLEEPCLFPEDAYMRGLLDAELRFWGIGTKRARSDDTFTTGKRIYGSARIIPPKRASGF